MRSARIVAATLVFALCGCSRHEREHTRDSSSDAPARAQASPSSTERPSYAPPERALWAHACQGFDAAVAAGAPPNQILSHTARHAVELGGPAVEAATRRWALLSPQAMLEELDAYALARGSEAVDCSGLRAHLERMAMRAAAQ